MQTKFVSLSLIVISVLLALTAWVTSAASPGQVNTIGATQTLSVIELQQGIATKSLPIQQIVDPF
jgi:hypothetical protein